MTEKGKPILSILAISCALLWGIGVVTLHGGNGYIHLLLVMAIVLAAARLSRVSGAERATKKGTP